MQWCVCFCMIYCYDTFSPCSYGFSAAVNSYIAFGYRCIGNETSLSRCSGQGAFCSADNPNFAIAVECGGQVGPSEWHVIIPVMHALELCWAYTIHNSPDLRLVDGSSRCHGRVEYRPTSFDAFGQVCDLNAGNSQAQVICRELGCNPTGARRVNPTKYVPRL